MPRSQGRRNRRKQPTRSNTTLEFKHIRREIERIQQSHPYEVRVPTTPPTLNLAFQIDRVIEIWYIGTESATGSWQYGYPSEPAKYFFNIPALNPGSNLASTFNSYELIKCFSCSFIRQGLRSGSNSKVATADVGTDKILPLDAFNLFRCFRINGVKMWGPTTSEFAGYPIELSVSSLHTSAVTTAGLPAGATVTPGLARDSTATVRDTGSRTRRSCCGLSIPQPAWWTLGHHGEDLGINSTQVIGFEIGFNGTLGWIPTRYEPAAVFHVSMSGILTREEGSGARLTNFDDDISDLSDEEDIEVISTSTSSKPARKLHSSTSSIRRNQ